MNEKKARAVAERATHLTKNLGEALDLLEEIHDEGGTVRIGRLERIKAVLVAFGRIK